jgi:hypothetical protein
MTRSLKDLREHLFETLENLKSKENPMDIDRAQAIASVSAQIINSAKVELQFLNTIGQDSLPPVVDPKQTGTFFAERPAAASPVKGLGTGKALGSVS